MKAFLAIIVSLLAYSSAEKSISLSYHENVGISLAEKIRQIESAADFDGARIVGGSPAAKGEYPHFGGLLVSLTSGATSVCGSSLLSNTRLVTAAHCWWDGYHQAYQFTVVLGSNLLFFGGTRITTSDVQLHDSYTTNFLNNDIAIIRTPWISYTDTIRPIALPTDDQLGNNFAGSWAQAVGFGRIGDDIDITTSQFLSHVTVQVIANSVCTRTYGAWIVIPSTLCTSGANGMGTCRGDSGGPLSVNLNGQPVLIGVTSFGGASCQGGQPAGFARITNFVPWIRPLLSR